MLLHFLFQHIYYVLFTPKSQIKEYLKKTSLANSIQTEKVQRQSPIADGSLFLDYQSMLCNERSQPLAGYELTAVPEVLTTCRHFSQENDHPGEPTSERPNRSGVVINEQDASDFLEHTFRLADHGRTRGRSHLMQSQHCNHQVE